MKSDLKKLATVLITSNITADLKSYTKQKAAMLYL